MSKNKVLKIKLFIVILLFSLNGFAQRIKTSDVLKISDSIILSNSNPYLNQFFTVNVGTYYSYKKRNRKTTGKFLFKNRLKRNVIEIWINYSFLYQPSQNIRGGLWVKLNKNLELIEPISLDFIPKFLWNNDKSNFISIERAKEIATKHFEKSGIKIDEPELMFNEKSKSWVFLVINKLNEVQNIHNKPSGNTEVIKVDAVTGEIIEKFDGYYGLIIR